jgi:hypothetical protein
MTSTTPNSSRASQSDDKLKRIRAIKFRTFISLTNILMVGYFLPVRFWLQQILAFLLFDSIMIYP